MFCARYLRILRRSMTRASSTYEISVSFSSPRPFPSFSPKKASIKDSELVYQVTTTLKLRRSESLRRTLRPFQPSFGTDHLVWTLMNLKNEYDLALGLYEWARIRREPSLEARCIVAQLAAAAEDLDTARWLISQFWGLEPGSRSYDRFSEKLIYTYKEWGSNPAVFDVFFRVLVDSGHLEEADAIFNKLLNYGVRLSAETCNALLARAFEERGGVGAGMKIFKEYREAGVRWDAESYGIVAGVLHRIGRGREARHLLLTRGLSPEKVVGSYTAVVEGHCKAGDIEEAFEVHNDMVRRGIIPNLDVYTALADGLCNRGEVEIANELLHEMASKGLELNVRTYNTMIKGLCKAGLLEPARNMMEEMKVAGPHPDAFTYTTLINAHAHLHDMRGAHALLRDMRARQIQPDSELLRRIEPGPAEEMAYKRSDLDAGSYSVAIKYFCERRRFEEAREAIEEMRRRGFEPDTETYGVFLDACYVEGNVDVALELCDKVIENCLLNPN